MAKHLWHWHLALSSLPPINPSVGASGKTLEEVRQEGEQRRFLEQRKDDVSILVSALLQKGGNKLS